jgi:hypothetical protein
MEAASGRPVADSALVTPESARDSGLVVSWSALSVPVTADWSRFGHDGRLGLVTLESNDEYLFIEPQRSGPDQGQSS